MALYRLVCAFGYHSMVTVLTRCRLPLPVYFLTDEKHSRCLTEQAYLPTIVRGRVLWHLEYTVEASVAAFTQSYGEFQWLLTQLGFTPLGDSQRVGADRRHAERCIHW
jgi:hypothetical protein